MKTMTLVSLLALVIFTLHPAKDSRAATPPATVSFQVFYDGLSPYGTWVSYSTYGYVWVPRVGVGFFPYGSNGHWEYTEYGWMWVSDFPWGWAPFHYGRWIYDDLYGWLWVPGYSWSPAWVVWGDYGDYWAWAPMGFYTGLAPAHYWFCVSRGHFYHRNIYNYRVRNTIVVNNITIINNTRTFKQQQYFSGPNVSDVAKATGKRISPVAVVESSRPTATKSEGNRIAVYRPEISKAASEKAAPAKVERLENLKRVDKQPANAPVQKSATPVNKDKSPPASKMDQRTTPTPERPSEKNVKPSEGEPVRVQPAEKHRSDLPATRESPKTERQPSAAPQQRTAPPVRQAPPIQPNRQANPSNQGGGRGKPK